MKFVDPDGKDVRLEAGNDTGNWINDLFHQYISVDVYDEQGKVIGEKTYSYGMIWFGVGSVYVRHNDDPCNGTYDFHDGAVEDIIFLNQEETNEIRDILDYMVEQKMKGPYLIVFANCRTFCRQTMAAIRELYGKKILRDD